MFDPPAPAILPFVFIAGIGGSGDKPDTQHA
jgi:hypothetical protein